MYVYVCFFSSHFSFSLLLIPSSRPLISTPFAITIWMVTAFCFLLLLVPFIPHTSYVLPLRPFPLPPVPPFLPAYFSSVCIVSIVNHHQSYVPSLPLPCVAPQVKSLHWILRESAVVLFFSPSETPRANNSLRGAGCTKMASISFGYRTNECLCLMLLRKISSVGAKLWENTA